MDISILLALQSFRLGAGAFLTDFFSKMTFLGELPTAILLMGIIYWCVDKRLGTYLLLGWTCNRLINGFLKVTACAYRPWVRDERIIPDAKAKITATGYSFPSGHSMIGASFFGGIGLYRDVSLAMRIMLFTIVFLIAFSRIFLTVHTPQDVLVGVILGVGMMFAARYILDFVESHSNGDIIVCCIMIGLAIVAAIYAAVKPYPEDYDAAGKLLVDGHKMASDTYKGVGRNLAFCIGWIIERRFIKFDTESSMSTRGVRLVGGVIGYYIVSLIICPLAKSCVGGAFGHITFSFIEIIYIVLIVLAAINFFEKRNKA